MKQIYLVLLSLVSFSLTAQDIHFVQTSTTPIYLNPGATGVFQGWERVSISHRQQWFTLGSPYVTTQISADLNILKQIQNKQKAYMGIGINFYNDVAGDAKLGTNHGSLLVSGVVNITDNQTVSAGLQIGAAQQSANLGNLTWASQFNGEGFDADIVPGEGNGAVSFVYPDFGAGVYYNLQNVTSTMSRKEIQHVYGGISYFHLSSPTRKFYNGSQDKLDQKFIAMAGAEMDVPGTKFVFAPSFAFFKQGPNSEILGTLAAKARIKEGTKYTGIYNNSYLIAGVSYRNKDAVAPMLGFEISSYKLSLAYEFNISALQTSTNSQGSFEVTFQWANFQTALFQGRRTKGFQKPGGM